MKRLSGRICVILLNWNGKKDTLECLDSLEKSDYPHFQTIVIDNGSNDGSVEAIRARFPEIPIFETGENLGYAGGNNVGIEWALKKRFEWIFLLNNDTKVAPNLLTALIEAAKEEPSVKIFGAKIYRYGDPKKIDHFGGRWDREIGEFISIGADQIDDGISFSVGGGVDYVSGCALFMHRSVPETIGLLEPRFFLYWEETDFCFRAKRAGFEIKTVPNAHVYHKVSSSFIGGKPHMQYFWWRGRLLWIERNLAAVEKKGLYRKVIIPELWKFLRHYLLKTLQSFSISIRGKKPPLELRQKRRRYQAGLAGACHYFLKRFGNCPDWIFDE